HGAIALTCLRVPSLPTRQLLHRGRHKGDHACRKTISRQEVPGRELTEEVFSAHTFQLDANGTFRWTVTRTCLDDCQAVEQRLDFGAPELGTLRQQRARLRQQRRYWAPLQTSAAQHVPDTLLQGGIVSGGFLTPLAKLLSGRTLIGVPGLKEPAGRQPAEIIGCRVREKRRETYGIDMALDNG